MQGLCADETVLIAQAMLKSVIKSVAKMASSQQHEVCRSVQTAIGTETEVLRAGTRHLIPAIVLTQPPKQSMDDTSDAEKGSSPRHGEDSPRRKTKRGKVVNGSTHPYRDLPHIETISDSYDWSKSTSANYGSPEKKFFGPYASIRATLDYEYHGNYLRPRYASLIKLHPPYIFTYLTSRSKKI